jgi:predicted nucleotidyltransferase component of viral defense system
MLRVIPHVTAEDCFALKGGTAINLFVRDMPRQSVDIDFAYLPVDEPRETAVRKMSSALTRVAAAVKKAIPGAKVQETRIREPDRIVKLVVATGRTRIRIEPNEVTGKRRAWPLCVVAHEMDRSHDPNFVNGGRNEPRTRP